MTDTDTHCLHGNLRRAALNHENTTIGGGLFKPAEIKRFLDIYDAHMASRGKGWALAKSLQTQVNILLPVVEAEAASKDECESRRRARAALEALAAHRET